MKELLRIHLLALGPLKVFAIVLGVLISLGCIPLIAKWAGIHPTGEISWLAEPSVYLRSLFLEKKIAPLLLIFLIMATVWAILGGGATRLMSQDILTGSHQDLVDAMKFCSRWALFFPSTLATACFFLILLAPWHPWLLLPVLPLWLYAGFIYGALTAEKITLKEALGKAHAKIRKWKIWIPLQFKFLLGFFLATGMVYSLALGIAYTISWILGGGWDFLTLSPHWDPRGLLVYPILLYAAGYTTSNLKSLQIYLYNKVR